MILKEELDKIQERVMKEVKKLRIELSESKAKIANLESRINTQSEVIKMIRKKRKV